MPRNPNTPFTLTKRDLVVLQFITDRRGAPIEHVAAAYFAVDPFTLKTNRNPLRACEQRLRALAAAGYVTFVRQHDGRQRRRMVLPANGVNGLTCARANEKRVPARNGAHHVRTQDAVARIERAIRQRGGRVLKVQLDADLRGDAQRGRRTRAGDSFDVLPDAVCTVELPGLGEGTIAVEYVTSKYTDADIRTKHAAFARFNTVVWVADRSTTAERVNALTGKKCTVL
jgi:hypothetical protein